MTKDVRRPKESSRATVQEKSDFSRADGEAAIFLNFAPRQKLKDSAIVAIYDLDNQRIVQTPPARLAPQAERVLYLSQPFSITNFQPGVYRADVIMDGNPVWRAFFRVTD
jgi:hypothetical protein